MTKLSPKQEAIAEFFAHRSDDISRAAELLASDRYHEEGWLVTSCHIAALASSRYPDSPDRLAFTTFVRTYTREPTFWSQIDLLFFYQLSRSKFRDNRTYANFEPYPEIIRCLERHYGEQAAANPNPRFVPFEEILGRIEEARIPIPEGRNLRDWLGLFTIVEQLYRYVRSGSVHEWHFPFVTCLRQADGSTRFEPNHIITAERLIGEARALNTNLAEECAAKSLWPQAL